ncbi:MAG: LytTR family DNA-binding domain-containing protein [Kofleriaceae bacterium]
MRVVIVDDEALARQRLERLVAAHPDATVVASLGDAEAAVEAIAGLAPDLIFLDVRMPKRDGFDVADAVVATRAELVFVTAYDAYAVRAFAAGALDYLLKPVDAAQVGRALDRVRARSSGAGWPERLAVRDGSRFVFVPVAELDAVVADGNYVELRAAGRRYSLRSTLGAVAARLDPARFVRLHRSVLVRTEQIAAIEPLFRGEYLVTLTDGSTFTSSRTQRAALRGALGLPA